MSTSRILSLFLLCLLLLPGAAHARETHRQSLSFADSLFAEGDYYRAITEYKRFLFLSPGDPQAPRAELAIGRSYLAGSRWSQAEAALRRVERDFPGSPQAGRAALLLAEIPFRRGDYPLARSRLQLLLHSFAADPVKNKARSLLPWTLIEENRFAEARRELLARGTPGDRQLAAALPPLERLPRKSPLLAGTLSAVLPGAGQLYAGRPRDAVLALALNGAFIAGAWQSFHNGEQVVGGILLFFEAGWYSGNIYNAVNSTYKLNRDRREAAKERLRQRFGLGLIPARGGAELGVRLKF